jgi:ribonuclease BN (tRNA processing enzyme)
LFRLDAQEIDATSRHPRTVFRSPGLTLQAVGVVHGSVPALGFLADVRGHRVAFSGDQNGNNPAFARMIDGAELLIMDYAVPEHTNPVAAALHARPGEIARLAAGAKVGSLVLSHVMARSERALNESLDIIGQGYGGPVTVAADLVCLPLSGDTKP